MARPESASKSDTRMRRFRTNAAKTTPQPLADKQPPAQKRPPIQFSLTTLLVLMAVFSLASAPAYYLMRAEEGSAGMQLPGMIVLLTGPIFLAIIASALMSALSRWKRR
jgi:hypothetical protein